MLKMGCDEKQEVTSHILLDQHGSSLQLADRKQEVTAHTCTRSTWWLVTTGCDRKQEVTSHICTKSTWWFIMIGCDRKQEVAVHPIRCSPNAGTNGGGHTRTVARDVNVCSQKSSLANEHQWAAALPRNTTQAADSVTFS
jgi:uncharacterized lipoprotein NlpE involved in copper resistance